ncbi:MAG: 2Fe-2S iron-sulfur cluster binding domain-containing protein [Pseudomonadota bacterium]
MPRVSFLNEVTTVEIDAGKTIEEAANRAGVRLHQPKVWVLEQAANALGPRTIWEKIRRAGHGALRLACQARVFGDIEVRTQPGFLRVVEPTTRWDPDPRPARWKERLAAGSEKPDKVDGAAKPAKPAQPPKSGQAVQPATKTGDQPAAPAALAEKAPPAVAPPTATTEPMPTASAASSTSAPAAPGETTLPSVDESGKSG